MKKSVLYLVLFPFIFLMSCNNSDDSDDTTMTTDDSGEMMEEEMMEEESEEMNLLRYYSLTEGDTWRYAVTTDEMETTSETLTVSGTTTIEANEFSTFQASELPAGFMTNVLSGGALRETEAELFYTGSIVLPFEGNEIALALPITPVYNQTAANGEMLSSFAETIVQEVEQDGMMIPLTITTTIETTQIGIQNDVTIGDFTFDSVLTSSISIKAIITAEFFGINVIILEEQNVLAINNRYAENVGLVESTVQFNYELVDLSALGIELPFPETGSSQSTQIIDTFEVVADD